MKSFEGKSRLNGSTSGEATSWRKKKAVKKKEKNHGGNGTPQGFEESTFEPLINVPTRGGPA